MKKTLFSCFAAALAGLVLSASVAVAAPAGRVSNECRDCGTVTDIDEKKTKGEASGAGAVMGAVVGGVIGHQFGSGKGNDAATAAGAVGGGVVGHQAEKRAKGDTFYRISIKMDDGDLRTLDVPVLNGLSEGSRVKVVGNNIQMATG